MTVLDSEAAVQARQLRVLQKRWYVRATLLGQIAESALESNWADLPAAAQQELRPTRHGGGAL